MSTECDQRVSTNLGTGESKEPQAIGVQLSERKSTTVVPPDRESDEEEEEEKDEEMSQEEGMLADYPDDTEV